MNGATHAFEDDITIEQAFENGEVIYLAYTAGQLIERYPPRRAGNAKVAKQLAAGVLSNKILNKDLLDVAAWFADTHPTLPGHFSLQRYRFQRWHKVFSHIIVFSTPDVRERFTAIVGEAFRALGWQINPHGGSSADWLETPILTDMSAHQRLSALGRVERALQAQRKSRE
jgi:predicted AlkP superfamily pyrophosphatase or phosphodiesterase